MLVFGTYSILSESKYGANMDSKIQPILCCVGAAVAGRPTQFLMERAFESANCDWRVITVEVQPKNFQSALVGMRAMAFTAIRFFPELQPLAASQTLEQPYSSFNVVTSAMRHEIQGEQDRWDYWDNQGFGLLDLITSVASASSTLVWLHGRSRLTQSLHHAMQAAGFVPSHLIWSDVTVEKESPEATAPALTPLADMLQTLTDAIALPNAITHVVVVGEAIAEKLPLMRDLEFVGEMQLSVATNQLLTREELNQAWSTGKTKIFTETDQLIAAEAYDFRRWTGKLADMDLLRDAYDEYADF